MEYINFLYPSGHGYLVVLSNEPKSPLHVLSLLAPLPMY
jgi:hypothetical protein